MAKKQKGYEVLYERRGAKVWVEYGKLYYINADGGKVEYTDTHDQRKILIIDAENYVNEQNSPLD